MNESRPSNPLPGSSETVIGLLDHFLCASDTAEFGPYRPYNEDGSHDDLVESLPRCQYRLRLIDRRDDAVEVQVFLGIGELGGLMWEQDIRALLRFAGSAHPALPKVLDGGYRSAELVKAAGFDVDGMAFVVTTAATRAGGVRDVTYFRSRKGEAVRQFRLLADGLATLHSLGLTHRNVSPAAIDLYPGPVYRFARFELSTLVTDVFRQTFDSVVDQRRLRDLFLRNCDGVLDYTPLERLDFLLADDSSNLVENELADVYGLAAVMWEWFLGPFPPDRRLPRLTEPPTGEQAVTFRAAHREFNQFLRTTLLNDESVPAELARVLHGMLAPDPADRKEFAAGNVVMMLTAGYDRIMSAWDQGTDPSPHVILYMPTYCAATIYAWGWINYHPASDIGEQQLVDFITRDLRRAHMAHSPHGADPFVGGGEAAAKREAKILLRGEQAVWFCDYYRFEDDFGNPTERTDRALVIKYVARRSVPGVEQEVMKLDWTDARTVPPVTMLSTTTQQPILLRKLGHKPSWRKLVDSLRPAMERSAEDLAYQRAINWLVDYQDVELRARMYPYAVVEGDVGVSEVLVRYDHERDQARIVRSPLFVKYAASLDLRAEFGTYLGSLQNEDGGTQVQILPDHNGRPGRADRNLLTDVVRQEGRDRVVLRRPSSQRIPPVGWLRADDDQGTSIALERQREARYALFESVELLNQIRGPATIRTLEHHWADAGAKLLGDGQKAVREILVCQPFMALQGPPGTGKTTVTAAAVAAYLRKYPTARLLLSAQSNYALDNLAERVLAEIGVAEPGTRPSGGANTLPLPLRVTSRGSDAANKVSDAVRPWTRHVAAEELASRLWQYADAKLRDAREPISRALADVLTEWRALVGPDGESVLPELSDRIHRGANVVFATCATSTPELLSPTGEAEFDWVIVEEAAKAWPTELAIPLARGRRWTLVGDHYQLPAHRKDDIARFLDSCINDAHQEIALVGSERADYLRAFELFGSLFAEQREPSRQEPPLLRMGTQFRMRKPIGQVVSRIFYPAIEQPEPAPADGLPLGGLDTDVDSQPEPVRFDRPRVLDNESLVWLDTGGLADCREEPHWSNPGEAAVVTTVLERLRPFPRARTDGFGENPIAVLTPYRQQLELLRGNSLARGHLNTIHGFQGREADLVIVSLVRDIPVSGRSGATLGHLAQRELVNVLLSRARRQLVIVGNFRHYETIEGRAGGFWPDVCAAVQIYGKVVSAAEFTSTRGGVR